MVLSIYKNLTGKEYSKQKSILDHAQLLAPARSFERSAKPT
jgi:hypothetical protein